MMLLRKNLEITSINGNEGTKIKQYFCPENTENKINYSMVHCTLESRKKSKRHILLSSEIYYILEGICILKINDKSFQLNKDDSMFIPPNSIQQIENIGPNELKFLCIVDPAWKSETEILLE